MSAPFNIVLSPPYVLISLTESNSTLESKDGAVIWGTVQQINAATVGIAVDDVVSCIAADVRYLIYPGSDVYWGVIDETKIFFIDLK